MENNRIQNWGDSAYEVFRVLLIGYVLMYWLDIPLHGFLESTLPLPWMLGAIFITGFASLAGRQRYDHERAKASQQHKWIEYGSAVVSTLVGGAIVYSQTQDFGVRGTIFTIIISCVVLGGTIALVRLGSRQRETSNETSQSSPLNRREDEDDGARY